ncbi:hypothetical protein BZA05DRAFT_444912 [Tricharina praecox]|uniref:uncharacterized protein n=1 Tax=Tricharina praecox TaxID=43433 RepID=UPI00221F50AB|nr:uncharacterized protein BZA05DRAFT_444912 [Tricharina praecox]KAI5852382.1 hypothetical protein BZA05DRAFT_444912 [Tricharina praecox]
MSDPPLLTLPNELFLHIFSYFSPVDLAPICLVNRRLNTLTTPQLYASHIADPNIFCSLPIATKVPARHTALVKHLHVWGQHPTSSTAAFSQCGHITSIHWDLGPDLTDARHFSTSHLSSAFMSRISTLTLELTTSFRGMIRRTSGATRTFAWFAQCFARCSRLRKLVLTPTWYELPPVEFIPYSGGPVAREQELIDEVDGLFGATLEHLVFRWCPPLRYAAPNMLLDSRLNAPEAESFPALRFLEVPFSSGLSPARKQDPEILPSSKILFHAYQISLLRPNLKILSHATAPNDQPTHFTPPLADLLHLPAHDLAAYHAWLLSTFPHWRGSYLYPEFHPAALTPSLCTALQTLTFSGLAHGLTHYIPHRLIGPPHALSFGASFSALITASGAELRSLTLETPPATDGAARWVRVHLPLLEALRALTVVSHGAPDAETAGMLAAVREFLGPLRVKELRLHVNVEAEVLAEVLRGVQLECLEVVGLAFRNCGSLCGFCAVLEGMPGLREVRIGGWRGGIKGLVGEGWDETRDVARSMIGDAVLQAVPSGCKVSIDFPRRYGGGN